MRDPLSALAETLLRAGIAPARVHRYLAELREHRHDIADELTGLGLSPADARIEAERRLGDPASLALPMLLEPRFRSWTSRLPALAWFALPLAAQLGLCLLPVLLLRALAEEAARRAVLADLGSAIAVGWLALPVLIAWIALALAHRHRARLLWPVIGAATGATLAAALTLRVQLPLDTAPGAIAVALAAPSATALLVLFALSLLPLAVLRLKDLPL